MSLDECEYIFDQALRSSSEAEFCHAINSLFEHYEILSLEFGSGNIFWRARLIENEPYSNLPEMDYPPAELSRAGRLNDIGSPCFYISATKETALAEIDAKEGQLIQLAGFRVLNEETIRLAVIGEYSNVQKNGYMHFAGKDPDMTISRIINSMPRQEALKTIYIDKFFAHILGDPNASKSGYLYSRALGQAIYSKVRAGGIAFPSVKDRNGFNVGVNADESDRAYHNVSCIVVKIGKPRKFGMIEYEVIKSAEQLDNDFNFVWMPSGEPGVIGIYDLNQDDYEAAVSAQNDINGLLNMIHKSRSTGRPA